MACLIFDSIRQLPPFFSIDMLNVTVENKPTNGTEEDSQSYSTIVRSLDGSQNVEPQPSTMSKPRTGSVKWSFFDRSASYHND
jgi:hypothetical protein